MSISADINTLRRDLAQRAETCGILAGHRWRSARERATDEALRAAYEELGGRLDVLARPAAEAEAAHLGERAHEIDGMAIDHAAEVEAALSELASTMREDFRERDVAGEIVRAYAARLDALVDGDGSGEEASHV